MKSKGKKQGTSSRGNKPSAKAAASALRKKTADVKNKKKIKNISVLGSIELSAMPLVTLYSLNKK